MKKGRMKYFVGLGLLCSFAAFWFFSANHIKYKKYSCHISHIPKKKKNFYRLSKQLKDIERADKVGMFIREKILSVRGVEHPYNPSIVNYGKDKYLMAFRYDVSKETELPRDGKFVTCIGIVELDKNFDQTEKEFVVVDTGSDYSEDARIFVLNGQYYLIFNDRIARIQNQEYRAMHIGLLNTKNFQLEYITSLDQHIKPVEKNWVPIAKRQKDGTESLLLRYNINPSKILGIPNPKSGEIIHHMYSKVPIFTDLRWWKWGEPRGGTPAIEVDGEYIAFFHSFFKSSKHPIKYWYVMGAYKFQKDAPYHITGLSKVPIVFASLYSTPINGKFADKSKRVAYPSGFVKGVENGREVFYVSIGENDCHSKIVVVDKQKLYESMQPVSLHPDYK